MRRHELELSPTEAAQRHPAYKTRMCADWQDGHCPRGGACTFAHGLSELTPTEAAQRHPAYKTRMCADWQDGHCPRGGACTFAHGLGDLRSLNQQVWASQFLHGTAHGC